MTTRGSSRASASPAKPTIAKIPASETVVLSKAEYERIKAASRLRTPDAVVQQRHLAEDTRAMQLTAAKARKERMLQLEKERTAHAPPSELEREAQENAARTKAAAEGALLEQRDEAKKMNEMMLYARVAAVRERQLEEKKQQADEVKQDDRSWAAVMEAERLRAISLRDEEERQKVEKRHHDAEVLRQQIQEREMQRLREQEQQERERDALVKRLEEERKAEIVKEETRREAGRRMLEEGVRANRAAAEVKERERLAEKVEDLKIVQYIKDKEKREREFEEEQRRIKAEKELEVCRLRAMQEKAIDKQALRDQLLAKRAQDQAEREWRAKQKAEAEKAAAMQAELARAREDQIRAREAQMIEMAQQEKVTFERNLQVQREKAEAEAAAEREAEERARRHAIEIRQQIEAARDKFARERQAQLQEGEALRRQLAADKAKVEQLREQKIQELRAQGIPEKYISELVRAKF